MQMIGQCLGLLLALYLTLVIMGIGFAMMLAGGEGATATARYCLVSPLAWAVGAVRRLIARVMAGTWHLLVGVLVALGQRLLRYVVDPLILGIERLLRKVLRTIGRSP